MTKNEMLERMKSIQGRLLNMYRNEEYYSENPYELLDDIYYLQREMEELIILYRGS